MDPGSWTEALRLPLLGRLLLALVLGAAVGIEREVSGKPAGLRTNILICVGAMFFTEISLFVAGSVVPHDLIRSDPGRIAAQIVSGIGFIGAGTILVARGNILGLTTAATLWVVAAIGMAVGVHLYWEAVGATVLVVLTLFALGRFEEKYVRERSERTLEVTVDRPEADPGELESLLERLDFRVTRLGHSRERGRSVFTYAIRGTRRAKEDLLEELARRKDIQSARVE